MIKTNTVNNIIDYIEDNIEKSLSIDDVALHIGYSRRYIELLFNQYTGKPIGFYIRSRRLTRAAFYLKLTRMSILSIAFSLQFSSQQSFGREFKKFSGYTPHQYRKMKGWDLSIIVSSLRTVYPFVPPLDLVELPISNFYGYKISYDTSVLDARVDGKGRNYRWSCLYQQLSFHKKNIILKTNFSPSLKSKNELSITTAIGVQDKEVSIAKHNFNFGGGKYAKFDFLGSKDEYFIFYEKIYSHFLPFYRMTRGNKSDLEILFYDDSIFSKGMIKIVIYIPIEC